MIKQNTHEIIYKIPREIARVASQILGIPGWTARLLLNNLYHDLLLRKRNQVTEGARNITSKLAIYLIFPAEGVDEFHRRTIRELDRNNYSTIIVSNLRLSESDKSFLQKNSLRIIERVNFGHDFGGYREAILSSQSLLANCEKLLLINDSSIFPLQPDSTWIQEAESSGWDLTGSISMQPFEAHSHLGRKSRRSKMTAVNRRFHYASFALLLSDSIAQSKDFQKFFLNLKLSSVKREVVKRGEMGLTQWAIKQGFSHGALLTRDDIAIAIKKLSQEELLEEISLAVVPKDKWLASWKEKRQELLQDRKKESKEWRQAAVSWLESISTTYHPAYLLPHLLHSKCSYPFLKKAIIPLSDNGWPVYMKILGSPSNS